MADVAWGVRRSCQGCGARFYDLEKDPITCPKCGTLYELVLNTRSKKGRVEPEARKSDVLDIDEDLDLDEDLDTDEDDLDLEDDSDMDAVGKVVVRDNDDDSDNS